MVFNFLVFLSFFPSLPTHTGERPYPCDKCSQKFISLSNLNQHKKIHSDEKPFQCLICTYKCKRKDILNSYMNTHSGKFILTVFTFATRLSLTGQASVTAFSHSLCLPTPGVPVCSCTQVPSR